MARDKKPNIVLLVTDHQLFQNHPFIKRPIWDMFRQQSFVFSKACCCTPLCGPARRTLLSGLYPHHHQNLFNQAPAPFTQDTYLERLAKAGYHNYAFGKWHAGPGTALDHATSGYSLPGYGNPYTSPEYKAYLDTFHLPMASHSIFQVFPNPNTKATFPDLVDGATGYVCTGSWCGEQCIGRTDMPKETHEAFFLAHLACEQLKQLAKNRSSQPFHLRVDFWGPHQPYFPTQEYIDLYKDEHIPEFGSYHDTLKDKPTTYKHMNRPIANEKGEMIVPSVFPWSTWERFLKVAYAHTTMIDDAIGLILHQLEESGFGEDTIVIWTSDHGDALASHGGMFDKGSFMTEETIRIPLAIRMPNRSPKESTALVNSIDIAPTILDMAGTGFETPIDGTSLVRIINGEQSEVRRQMLLESFGQGYRDTTQVRTLVDGHYKYNATQGDIDELYDLDHDPFEMHNLVFEQCYQKKRVEMRGRLKSEMVSYGEQEPAWMKAPPKP